MNKGFNGNGCLDKAAEFTEAHSSLSLGTLDNRYGFYFV
jgi:hypothetical protein